MDEERPDASLGEPDRLGTDEDEVDAQQLLSAASRAIAAVRHQAADLFRRQHAPHGEGDERPDGPPSVS